ncbi:MAG: hypothetical protein AB4426_13495 [Xenococcaceae cyanobacterium]
MTNQDAITVTIRLNLIPTEDGRYLCHLSTNLTELDRTEPTFSGQTKEHAIAVALEHLAAEYRSAAEQSQVKPEGDDTVGSHEKRYHVILHYERIASEKSRFDAVLNTLLGNTVVENAITTVIEIAADAEQSVLS